MTTDQIPSAEEVEALIQRISYYVPQEGDAELIRRLHRDRDAERANRCRDLQGALDDLAAAEAQVAALTAACLEPAALPGWRDMETAPKDGTPILAAIEAYRNGEPYGWEMHVIAADDETGEVDLNFDQGWRWEDYSHWMPLPAPPGACLEPATIDAQASVIAATRERALREGKVEGLRTALASVGYATDIEEAKARIEYRIAALRAEQSQEREGAVAGNHPSDTLGPKLRGWLKHFRERHGITENDKRTLEAIFAEVLAKHEGDPSHDG